MLRPTRVPSDNFSAIYLAGRQSLRLDNGMTRSREDVCENRGLSGITGVHREIRGSRAALYFSAFLVSAALVCGCQSPLPPLPYPPGPHTAVRLSPGDVIKVAYADESVPDQTQKIRRDGR